MADTENTASKKPAFKLSLTSDESASNGSPNLDRKLTETPPSSNNPIPLVENLDVPEAKWWKKLQIEFFIFMYMFGYTLNMTTNPNLLMERGCLVNYNETRDVCFNLSSYQHVLNKVQAQANNMTLYTTLIAMLPGAVYAMFIGSWSDKYGRKSPLLVAVIGSIIQDVIQLLFVYYESLRVEYFLLSSVPMALTGGMISILAMVYSMQSDKTSESNRTLKYAILEGFYFLALPLSSLAAGQIFKYWRYTPVYGTGLIIHVITLVYGFFQISDDRSSITKASFYTKMTDFFAFGSVKENFKTCFKKRENKARAQILLLMPCGCVLILNYISLASLTYLFANKMYGWDLPQYTTISTAFSLAGMAIMIIMIPILTRVMKITDSMLGLIGIVSLTAQNVSRGLATEPWIFYISHTLGLMCGAGPMAFRSKLSKTVSGDELGKIFAVLAIFESLAPTPGTLFVTFLYNNTLEIFPGLVYLVTATLLIYPICVFIWLLTLPTVIPSDYESMIGDDICSVKSPETEGSTPLSSIPVKA